MAKGLIVKLLAGYYYIDNGSYVVRCRGRGKLRNDDIKPMVGDIGEYIEDEENDSFLIGIDKRKNQLTRPAVSNVDQVLLVFSIKEPDLDNVLLDKMLLMIESKGIKPIICFSKIDLGVDDNIRTKIDEYKNSGYDVYEASVNKQESIDLVKTIFKDKITVIAGQSGVGKSSLLNALDIQLKLETGKISKSRGRGKHTTRHVELIPLFGGYIGDTPGFSSLELNMTTDEVCKAYHDFLELSASCKFRGCKHIHEPKCAIKQAVEDNIIPKSRYQNYVRFYEEVKKQEDSKYD